MKQTETLTHSTHVNGWEPAVYFSCVGQHFRLFHVSNLSVRNFRVFLLMYPGSPSQAAQSVLTRRRGTERRARRSASSTRCTAAAAPHTPHDLPRSPTGHRLSPICFTIQIGRNIYTLVFRIVCLLGFGRVHGKVILRPSSFYRQDTHFTSCYFYHLSFTLRQIITSFYHGHWTVVTW